MSIGGAFGNVKLQRNLTVTCARALSSEAVGRGRAEGVTAEVKNSAGEFVPAHGSPLAGPDVWRRPRSRRIHAHLGWLTVDYGVRCQPAGEGFHRWYDLWWKVGQFERWASSARAWPKTRGWWRPNGWRPKAASTLWQRAVSYRETVGWARPTRLALSDGYPANVQSGSDWRVYPEMGQASEVRLLV